MEQPLKHMEKRYRGSRCGGCTIKSLQAELEEGGVMARLRDLLLAESTLEYLLETTRQ